MRVDFYHLEKVSLDDALPQILQKAYIVVIKSQYHTDKPEAREEMAQLKGSL